MEVLKEETLAVNVASAFTTSSLIPGTRELLPWPSVSV